MSLRKSLFFVFLFVSTRVFAADTVSVISSGGGSGASNNYGIENTVGQTANEIFQSNNFEFRSGMYNTFDIDIKPPRTTLTIGDPKYISGDKTFITKDTILILNSTDDMVNTGDGIGFGVESIIYSIDDRTISTSQNPVQFALAGESEGRHLINYYAVDKQQNIELTQTLTVYFDNTPPVTGEPHPVGLNYTTGNSLYVVAQTSFALTATDNMSGVRYSEYIVDSDATNQSSSPAQQGNDTSGWATYTNPFPIAQPEAAFFPAGIISNWSFDEGSGTKAADSADSNPGTLVNGPVWTEGRTGYGIKFDGSDDYVEVSDRENLNPQNALTIETWLKRDREFGETEMLVNKGAGAQYYLNIYNNSPQLQLVGVVPAYFTSQYKLEAGKWYHIVFTYDGSSVKCYVNGNEVNRWTAGGKISVTGDSLKIGNMWSVDERNKNYKGVVDEFAIYNRALSKEEIALRMQGVPPIREGTYEIAYRSRDNVENVEQTKNKTVITDETPPESALTLSGPQIFLDPPSEGDYDTFFPTGTYTQDSDTSTIIAPKGYSVVWSSNPGWHIVSNEPAGQGLWLNFITKDTQIGIESADKYSGVKVTSYSVSAQTPGTGIDTTYTGAFRLTDRSDGLYYVNYQSQDNLNHYETIKSSPLYVDNSAPVSGLKIKNSVYEDAGSHSYNPPAGGLESSPAQQGKVYISQESEIIISSSDGQGCGVKYVKYGVNGPAINNYTKPFTLSEYGEGAHTISYYSEDLLGNVEIIKSSTVILDKTAPQTQLNIEEPKLDTEIKTYLTSQTSFTLTAVDPIIQGASGGSGVKISEYRFDAGQFVTYKGVFMISNMPAATDLPAGVISRWSFDENAGLTAQDSTDSNPGTLVNGPVWTEGKTGSGLKFDGTDDYVEIPDNGNLNPQNEITIETWLKRDREFGETEMLMQKGSGGQYYLNIYNNSPQLQLVSVVPAYFTSQYKLEAGMWYHLAFTYDGNNVRCYVNGEEVNRWAAGGKISVTGGSLKIGNMWSVDGSNVNYKGAVDEFAIYSRALTPDEITARYAVQGGIIQITEGTHTFSYRSIDNVDNKETQKSKNIVLDDSPPQITITSPASGEKYVAKQNRIKINYGATDLGPFATTAYLTLTDCVDTAQVGTRVPVNSGDSLEPLNLPYYGFYTLTVEAEDWSGHKSSSTTPKFEVIWDIKPPRSNVSVGVPKYIFGIAGEKIFITSSTYLTITSSDDLVDVGDTKGLGVASISYWPDAKQIISVVNPVPETGKTFITGFTLDKEPEGAHTIFYFAKDTITNTEQTKTLFVIIDNSTPNTTLEISSPTYNEYFTSSSQFMLSSVDLGVIPCGVQETKYRINGDRPLLGDWVTGFSQSRDSGTYYGTYTVTGQDGVYEIEYYSSDNLNNTEITKSTTVKLDNTPPASTLTPIGSIQWVSPTGALYASANTQYVLAAEDPVKGGVSSGLAAIYYKEDNINGGGAYAPYTNPITLTEGAHTLAYYSVDNLGNTETPKTFTVNVDATPPETIIVVGEPKFDAFGTHYISTNTQISFTAIDPTTNEVASGIKEITYSIDNVPFTLYASPFTLQEGTHTITYWSLDNVENSESAKEYKVHVTIIPDYALTGTEKIKLSGNARVTGNIISAGKIKVSGNAKVTGTIYENALLNPYPINLSPIIEQVNATNDNQNIPLTQKGKEALDKKGVLKLEDSDTLTLATGTYYVSGLEIEGKSELKIEGQVRVLCKGEVEIEGDALVNYSEAVPHSVRGNNNPYNLMVFVSSYGPNVWMAKKGKEDDDNDKDDASNDEDNDKSKIKVSGKSKANLLIYAPFSQAEISGQSAFTGSMFAKEIKLDGDATAQISLSTKTVTNNSDKKSAAAISLQANTDFKLGNVYAYPNPAKNGQTPTLHIEVGLADTVEIKIFNIAAELVHTAALPNTPLTDKNSDGTLEYEYAWPGTNNSGQPVASGIYIYYIEARKSGYSPITVIKKLAIIR